MRGVSPAIGGLQLKPGGNLMHATKNDLMHVQGQVNALISEVRDMRTLMHQYMMEVDKRVNLFSMEMHGVGGQWYPMANQAAAGTYGQGGAGAGQPAPAAGAHQLDAAATASLAAMVSAPSL
jgi:hypothetical protein